MVVRTWVRAIALLLVGLWTAGCGGRSYWERFPRRPAVALRTTLLASAPTPPPAALPAHLDRANAELPRRRAAILQRYLDQLASHGIDGDGPPRSRSVRRIAAALFALSAPAAERGPLRNLPERDRLARRIEDFAARLPADARPGTVAGIRERRGDHDFVMKELVSLLHRFADEPALLTDEAAFLFLDRGLAPFLAEPVDRWLTFQVQLPLLGPALRYPETENHVLMTLSSVYLARQWVAHNPRGDPRLRTPRYRRIAALHARDPRLVDLLLQATGRVLHNGFWEVNGRPYQAMSAHALINLATFADDARVRSGARNALDYLAAKFAFQSVGMKRHAPYRRCSEYAQRAGLYEPDGVPYLFGVLAGGHSWAQDFPRASNAAGHALWASLLDYRVPAAIHDYMLDKHSGFWARMQSRFGSGHYRHGRHGRYFRQDGRAHSGGEPEYLPESYFVTPRFMNAAGGRFNRYPIFGDALDCEGGLCDLDFVARPHVILPEGHLQRMNGVEDLQRAVPTMIGDARPNHVDNSGTYKGFSYGYLHDGEVDRHLDSPLTLPALHRAHLYRVGGEVEFFDRRDSRARFSFVDLSDVPGHGYYLVLGRVSKSENSACHRHYARGFWEVVPAERFATVAALTDYVLQHNPAAAFTDVTEGPGRFYRYTMTTGEVLELDDRLGHPGEACSNPIRRIWRAGRDPDTDAPERLSELVHDRCDPEAVARAPLMDVREVDPLHRFTGRRLAYAAGDGLVVVDNPHIGRRLVLDSSDYRNPRRRRGLP